MGSSVRLLVVTAVATIGVMMPGVASAGGVFPYVVGSGDFTPAGGATRHFAVSADSGPQGVSGKFTAVIETTPFANLVGDVTCLYAQGNRAVVGVLVRSDPINPGLVGVGFLVAFVDNGVPSQSTTPDLRSAAFNGQSGAPTQAACVNAFPTAFTTLFPISPGDVTVNAGAVWDPATDFRLFPNQANPSPDSLGNPSVWSYMFSDGLVHDPAHYHLLPHYSVVDAISQQWDSGDATTGFTPLVRDLTTQHLLDMAPHGGQAFSFGNFAILAWRSPVAGTVNINGDVFLGDSSCTSVGSGIIWSIDKGSTSLQSSLLLSGGNMNFSLSTTVQVGDTLYFISDPGFDDLCDSTDVSMLITKP